MPAVRATYSSIREARRHAGASEIRTYSCATDDRASTPSYTLVFRLIVMLPFERERFFEMISDIVAPRSSFRQVEAG